ncbi:hypothetical protein MRY82_09770 [bacterium]|nr:hypothetical protein [bacterium]
MKRVSIYLNIVLGLCLVYNFYQIRHLNLSVQNLKKDAFSSQTEKSTSVANNEKNAVASPAIPYDNKHILSVLDYLQEEIDHLKNRAQTKLPSANNNAHDEQSKINDFPKLELNSHDHNSDRYLSAEEAKLSQLNFNSYDIDEDGKISDKEIDSAKKRLDKAQRHVQKRDRADGAFPIEHNAWSRSQKEFNFIDQNNDLMIDESEYIHYLSQAKQQLRRFDYNRDSWISFDEFGQGEARFAQIDHDSDQKIYEHEIRKAMYRGFW